MTFDRLVATHTADDGLGHLATKASVVLLRTEVAELRGEVRMLRWTVGFNLALSTAILVKLLLLP